MLSVNKRNGLLGQVWADDDVTAADDQLADYSAGLTSLGFIRAAIRRSVWFWGALAIIGVLLGTGLYLKSPPLSQASTTLLLKVGPEAAPGTAIQDDQVIAQSRTVAGIALHQLGLQESVSDFVASYTATVLTDQALLITVTAPAGDDAVNRAKAVAAAFLQYRTSQLQAQQTGFFTLLNQQVTQQKQRITFLTKQISQLPPRPLLPSVKAKLSGLRAQRAQAISQLRTLQQNVNDEIASTEAATAQEVKGSGVVDPAAPVPEPRHARIKHVITYAIIGLIGGLVLGLGIVIIRALVSDRLRRRDDIAYALGAPVKLSVGSVVGRRLLPGRSRRLAAVDSREIERITAYLRRELPRRSQGPVTLAIVSLDSMQAAAPSAVGLAQSCAEQGLRVIVADLAPGSPAAHLLGGVTEPGVHMVKADGSQLAVAIPDPGDDVPTGPLDSTTRQAQPALANAFRSADLALTLITLDPAAGGEHLATWAAHAVVMVTAGASSWTKIHAVGEMVRLAGTRLVSGIVVGADKADESLGARRAREASGDPEIPEDRRHPDAGGSLFTVRGNTGGGQPDDT